MIYFILINIQFLSEYFKQTVQEIWQNNNIINYTNHNELTPKLNMLNMLYY